MLNRRGALIRERGLIQSNTVIHMLLCSYSLKKTIPVVPHVICWNCHVKLSDMSEKEVVIFLYGSSPVTYLCWLCKASLVYLLLFIIVREHKISKHCIYIKKNNWILSTGKECYLLLRLSITWTLRLWAQWTNVFFFSLPLTSKK